MVGIFGRSRQNQNSDQANDESDLQQFYHTDAETTSLTEVENEFPLVDPKEQIGFELERSKITFINRLLREIRSWENLVEVMPFWRSLINPLNITVSILTALITAVIVIINFNTIPNQFPLIFSRVAANWLLIDKSFLIVLPIIVIIVQLILTRLIRIIFDFDRRLSVVMGANQLIFNILFIIALIEIVNLVSL